MPIYEKELTVAKDIARKAGAIMLKYFDDDQHIELKEDASFVTIADKQINRLVIEELAKHFDDIVIGEEESTGEYGMGRRWLCDPIDGTKAYVWGTPTAMFSLGLVVDGAPVMGVAYDPFLDRLYEASLGGGSFCNGVALRVSGTGLDGGIVATTSSTRKIEKRLKSIAYLAEKGASDAVFSGAVCKICLVARGRFVGYFEGGIGAHDMAAAQVIVEEAGGKVTDFTGARLDYSKPFQGAVVSNGVVHDDLVTCANLN